MEVFLNNLQRQAVLHDRGPLFVLAGPGTGKTRILVERVRRMVKDGYPPEEICLVTFTTKAADEIRHRLSRDIGKDLVEHLNVSTLHSLALRIMIANERAHQRKVPEIADPMECYGLLKRAMEEIGIAENIYSATDLQNRLIWYKTTWKADLSILPLPMQEVIRRYNQILKSETKWDLSDLIAHAIQVLETEPDLALAFSSIHYLMVDEFQDTSLMEYEFLKLLLQGDENIMMVAAAAQSIYAWRGADFQALSREVEKDFPQMERIVLRENYRCGRRIIEAAASMTPEEDEVRLNGNRGEGEVLWNELPDNYAEANFIANTIINLNGQGVPLTHIAILFRSWRQASVIEQALVDRQIPYKLFGENRRFYERPEIQELVAYVQAIQALRDYNNGVSDTPIMKGAIDRIINTPPRGIGPRSKKLIRGNAVEISVEALVRAMARKDLREQVRVAALDLFNLMNRFAKMEIDRPSELIGKLLEETDWIRPLQQELDGRQAINRMQTLQEEAATYRYVDGFLNTMSQKVSFKMDDDGLALTTIHGAKGLEWSVVFLAGFNQYELPSAQSLREAAGGDPVEERHVAHVAFSRAKDLLLLSWYQDQIRPDGRLRPMIRSSFVGKIPQEVLHEFDEKYLKVARDNEPLDDYYASEEEAFEVMFG